MNQTDVGSNPSYGTIYPSHFSGPFHHLYNELKKLYAAGNLSSILVPKTRLLPLRDLLLCSAQ